MTYAVKEIFLTLQGEGANSGHTAVFLRFSGCNLWDGTESSRPTAVCRFCDTDFVGTDGPGGGAYSTAEELVDEVVAAWPTATATYDLGRLVVCTGGEPLLQLDQELIQQLHSSKFTIAVETNGTVPVPKGVDWVCVSPKAGAPLVQEQGDELKLVFPQEGIRPEEFEHMDFRHFFLQPKDGPDLKRNTNAALEYCLSHPRWRLGLQLHKLIGIR